MSDPLRPFGDTGDDQDLRREPTTDAPTGADALDALLNEIASGNGVPGSRQHEPNTRSEDAASVMETAAAFHRRVEAAQGRDARAAAPDPQLWETIMERAGVPGAIPGAVTTANPGMAHVTAKRRRASHPKRPEARRQHVWNMVANIGLAAAILLMAFGAWRAAGSPGVPGGGDGARPASNLAMQPATPDGTPAATEVSAVTAPVATPEPTTACDFSTDIPIFQGVDASPWDGTAVLLTTSGEIVLTCPEEPADTVLATTAGTAGIVPLGWPGIVGIQDYIDGADLESHRTRIVSLITGGIVEFGVIRSESAAASTEGAPDSPWVVGPAPGDTSDVQILDLRTMETRLLSDIAGTALPAHGGWLLSTSDDGNTLVLALLKSAHPTAGDATLVTEGLPGDLLVLDSNLEAASWIPAPDDVPPVVGFAVSPDGRYAALHGAKGTMREREHTWSIVSLDDGSEVTRSATVTTGPEPSEGIWIDSGFAYVDGSALMRLPIEGDAAGETVFRGDGPLTNLRATTDASTVLVDQEWGDDLATMVANLRTPTMFSVNVTTGAATTLTGVDVSANTNPWPYPTRFLVTFDYSLDSRDTVACRVIDALTGETVGTLDDVPLHDDGYEGYPMLGLRSVVSSADGETEIIAFDTQHIYLMQVIDGEPTVRQIASPPGLPGEYPLMAQMFLSPDGTLLSLSAEGDEARTRWVLSLDGAPDEWTIVENQDVGADPGYIFFIPGTGS